MRLLRTFSLVEMSFRPLSMTIRVVSKQSMLSLTGSDTQLVENLTN